MKADILKRLSIICLFLAAALCIGFFLALVEYALNSAWAAWAAFVIMALGWGCLDHYQISRAFEHDSGEGPSVGDIVERAEDQILAHPFKEKE